MAVLGPDREKRFPAAVYSSARLCGAPGSVGGRGGGRGATSCKSHRWEHSCGESDYATSGKKFSWEGAGEKGLELPWLLDARHWAVWLDVFVE